MLIYKQFIILIIVLLIISVYAICSFYNVKYKKFIILCLTTVLSLVYAVINYFDVIRYIDLHIDDIETYTNIVKNNPDNENKIIVSLDIDITNIDRLRPVINSILDQTIKVDQITLNIPSNYKSIIPNDILSVLTINEIDKIQEKNIQHTMNNEYEDTNIYVNLTDSKIYGKDFINFITKEIDKNNCTVSVEDGIFCTKSNLYGDIESFDSEYSNLKENKRLQFFSNYNRYL